MRNPIDEFCKETIQLGRMLHGQAVGGVGDFHEAGAGNKRGELTSEAGWGNRILRGAENERGDAG